MIVSYKRNIAENVAMTSTTNKQILALIIYFVLASAVSAQVDLPPNTWKRVPAPPVHPSVGLDVRFSYDPMANELVMFGGDFVCGVGYCRTTWTYSVPNNRWTMRNDDNPPMSFPAGRCQPGLAYDRDRNHTLMFSGCRSRPLEGYSWGNLWNYDISTGQWVDYAGSGPANLRQTCNAQRRLLYDDNRNKAILLAPDINNQIAVWEFDPVDPGWIQRTPSGAPYPDEELYVPVVYDSKRGNYIFVTAFNTDASGDPNPIYPGTIKYQTWIYNPNTNRMTRSASSQHPNPGGGSHGHEIVYDSTNDVVLFYGGNCKSELWEYDIDADNWAKLNPSGDIPPGHDYFAMAYDSTNNVMVVWGTGTYCNGGNHEDPPPVYLYRYGGQSNPPGTKRPNPPLGLTVQ
jgi:hypothetical protein